ncbi:hypothetical protein ACFSX5_18345 [Devosia albogilva]|uniref:Uncharacterized protein n=1 Tax=Devosia albogilva TaxID=429726 RepID=A0ABW5QQP4_9HYPH
MPQTCNDPDPYAELDNRADAGELSEEFRKPVRVRRSIGLGQRPRTSVRGGLR